MNKSIRVINLARKILKIKLDIIFVLASLTAPTNPATPSPFRRLFNRLTQIPRNGRSVDGNRFRDGRKKDAKVELVSQSPRRWMK
jgi:hypothetical protein